MSQNNEQDPAASTQMFRAFVEQETAAQRSAPAPAPHHRSGGISPAVIVGIVVAVIAVAVIAFVALS